jgi:hypothetical protein
MCKENQLLSRKLQENLQIQDVRGQHIPISVAETTFRGKEYAFLDDKVS